MQTPSSAVPPGTSDAGLPPLVPGLPLLGNALALLRAPIPFFVSAYHAYGPVYRIRLPTAPQGELTVLAGPHANRFAARAGATYFTTHAYYRHLTRETGTQHYLAALDGALHQHLRTVLAPGLSREALAPYLPAMVALVQQAARSWPPGQRVAVLATLQRLTLEQLSLAATNCPLDAVAYRDLETFARTFVGAGVALQPALLFHLPSYQRAKRRFEAFLRAIIAQHRHQGPDSARPPDLVDLVLAATDPDGQPLGEADLVACTHLPYVNGLIYAGRVCAYALYGLLRDPALLERVTAEVDAAFASGGLDLPTLRRMPLLRGAIMESYRLYPIAACIPRTVARPFTFEGYRIAAGTTVFIAICTTNFLPDLYPDPSTFDPDRYRPPRNEHHQPGAFAPYGLGAHVCLSTGYVETVVMVTLASLLRTIRLGLDPPDYTLRSTVNPVPGPERRFAVRVLAHRSPDDLAADPGMLLEVGHSLLPLDDLDQQQVRALVAQVQRRRYAPGATILRQGDPADAFYILAAGRVEVLREVPGREPQVVDRLARGAYFGEVGLLHGGTRTATVRVVPEQAAEVLVLDRDTFRALVTTSDLASAEIALLVRQRTVKLNLAAALPALTPDQLGRLSLEVAVRRYPAGVTIIREGEVPDQFYVLRRGQVDVVTQDATGHEVVLERLEPGDYFGEIGLLQNRRRTATVRATAAGAVEVLALERAAFLRLMEESRHTSDAVALVMCERLLRLAQQAGSPAANGAGTA